MQMSRLFVTAVGALLGAHVGCSPEAKTSGETHWLGDCDRDADCDLYQQCLCGVCSRACSGDADCGGPRAAQCFLTASSGLARRCSGLPPSGGICLAVCSSDSDCPKNEPCRRGACIAGSSSSGIPDSGDSNGGTADSGLPGGGTMDSGTSTGAIASKYVHVDAGVRLDSAIEPPTPSPLLYGADDSLVGHWAEFGGDGKLCTPEHNTAEGAFACMQLEIVRNAAGGGYTGTAYWLLSANAPAGTITGPFAPASDPERGYPTEVSFKEYNNLRERYPGGRYTAFEGRFAGNTLSFWVGGTELWKDWCALQTPYPFSAHVTADIRSKGYRCVPENATPDNTDLGKLALCTVLPDYAGEMVDCTPNDGGGFQNPICYFWMPWMVCQCFAKGCGVNLRAQPYSFSFVVSGATMVSTILDDPELRGLTLQKVSP